MDIEVVGGNKKLRSKIEEFTRWLGFELMGKRLANNIRVLVELDKFKGSEEGYFGFADYEDSNIRPRNFIVRINKTMTESQIMETLAHEMVHVKQDAKCEKVQRDRGGYRLLWKGVDHTYTPYSKQPWEREAYRLEKKLVKKYTTQ